jgi:hypothetical protein
MRWLLLLLLVATAHARPGRCAVDAQVVNWNYRCTTNNPTALNSTFSLLSQSQWMGAVRAAGLYPGNIYRANLHAGRSFGGTNGCGDSITLTNIGSPQVPLIADLGGAVDLAFGSQDKWKYSETGSSGGLGPNGTNHVTLNTSLAPDAIIAAIGAGWPNSAHLAYYCMGAVDSSVLLGVLDNAGANRILIAASSVAVGQETHMWIDSAGKPTHADTNGAGLYIGTRTAATGGGVQQYKNNTATGVSTSVGGTPVNLTSPIHIFGLNQMGVGVILWSPAMSGGYVIGGGVTASTATNGYYNAWQQYETLLSRQK